MKTYQRIFKEDVMTDVFSTDGLKSNYNNPSMNLDVFNSLNPEQIPVTKYFRYGYSYPSKLQALVDILILKLGEETFWKLFSDSKSKIINFNYIVPTTEYLSRFNLNNEYQGQTDIEKLPYLIFYRDRYFVICGHEEIINQEKFGKRIKAKVLDYDRLLDLTK